MRDILSVVEGSSRFALVQADAREVAALLPSENVLVLADPPYGIRYKPTGGDGKAAKRGKWSRLAGDDEPFDPAPFLRFERVAFFGANHYADRLPPASSWHVWDKRDGRGGNSFSDCEHIWTNAGGPARVFRHYWNGCMRASEMGVPRVVHPTQKPKAVMLWLTERLGIEKMEDPIIFEPFCGSAPGGCIAVNFWGCRYIGCDIEAAYLDTARERIGRNLLADSY